MGQRIMELMANREDYIDAISTMRQASLNIKNGFDSTYMAMEQFVTEKLSGLIKENNENKLCRKIILAGDDITFICNSQIAIPATKLFLEEITKYDMYNEEEESVDYTFTACAGIAYFYSHFPFSDAY